MSDKRITARLDEKVAAEMSASALSDGVPVSDRLAALAALWSSDPAVRARADEAAQRIAQERRIQRYDRRSRTP